MRPRVEKVLKAAAGALAGMTFPRASGPTWTFLTSGQRRYWEKVGDGSSSSVVMAPLLWIGRNFPEAPPALWLRSNDSGEEERVTGKGALGGDHLMLELLQRPNDYYSGSTLWMATLLDWHLSGDGYWIKIRDRGGRPVQLWWTPSGTMTPVGTETEFITSYEYRIGGIMHELPREQVVHFRYGMDPNNPRKGKSPLSSLLHEVFTDQEAAEFVAALLRNMGVPGVVIAPKGDSQPGEDDVKATKEYFKGAFSGERRGDPLVMSGPTNVSQFGFSPNQMNLRDIRRIPEERVTAVLGIPAIVCGLGAGLDRSTYANYSEAREAAYQDNIIPSQRMLSEDIHGQLLPDFQPDDAFAFRFGFDLAGVRVLQEDRNQLVERLNVGVIGGWVRVAEARRATDLEVDDADEIYLRSSATVEIPVGEAGIAPGSLLSPADPAQLPPGSQSGTPVPPKGGHITIPSTNGHNPESVKVTRLNAALHRQLMQDQHDLAKMFALELESDFQALGELCEAEFSRVNGLGKTRPRGGRLVKDIIDPTTMANMITETVRDEIVKRLSGHFKDHTLRTVKKTVDTISLSTGIGVGVSEEAQQRILTEGGKRLGLVDIDGQTKSALFNAIDQGNQAGSNPREIARSIRQSVPSGPYTSAGSGYRSQLIARTETNWAQNTASISAYREADAVDRVVAMDGGDDEECAARNGQEYSFDEAESELENEHPNGTLAFAPVVGDGVPV